MMVVAVCTETPDQVDNFLAGCLTGGRNDTRNNTLDIPPANCTTLTLTMISDVLPPKLIAPQFGYDYAFCNDGSYDSQARYPSEDFSIDQYWQENNITLCKSTSHCSTL